MHLSDKNLLSAPDTVRPRYLFLDTHASVAAK